MAVVLLHYRSLSFVFAKKNYIGANSKRNLIIEESGYGVDDDDDIDKWYAKV